MAKLLIYSGDVLDREVDLGDGNARIGRGDDNEIVLTDKSVSRHHAELRFEQDKYSVVDTNSQNGVWVDGLRVPNVTLEPGVPVVLGSYKLLLKDERPPAPDPSDHTILLRPNADAATMFMPRPKTAPPPSSPKVVEPKSAPPPAVAAAQAAPKPEPTAPKPSPPVPTVKPEPPRPAVQPVAAKPAPPVPIKPESPPAVAPPPVAAKPAAAARRAGKGMSKGLVFGGLAVVLVAVMAAAVFWTPLRNRLGLAESEPRMSTAAAPPADAPPPIAPTPAPPVPTPQDAPPAAGPPVDVKPTPAKPPTPSPPAAPTLKPASRKPATVVPPAAPTPPPAAAVNEPVEKPLDLAGMFEEARSAMIKGDYLAAMAGFEAVLKVDPNYPSAANLLGVARGGAKNASQLAVDSGNKAEMTGDYESATKQYERALLLDPPSSAAADAMRRLKARMESEGEDTFKKGKQYDAMGRKQDAISTYGRALQLLPPDHASAKAARERLTALKGGG